MMDIAQSTEESQLLDPDAVRAVGSPVSSPKTTGRSPSVFGSTSPVITNFQPSMDGVKRNMMNTEDTLRPIHAYTSVSMCANLTLILLHFPVVAPFAPIIGFGTGLGLVYLFSKGYR